MNSTQPLFAQNIFNAFGAKGQNWLNDIPNIIEKSAEKWQLTNIVAVKNMTWNYVCFAKQGNQDVVLKLAYEKNSFDTEYQALKDLQGLVIIRMLDHDTQYKALLLERALPGNSLKFHQGQNKLAIYCRLIKSLSRAKNKNHTHIREWLKIIDEITDSRISNELISAAKKIRAELLNSIKNPQLCHGDLHLDNIIQSNKKWLAIDPKGVIGEIAFEASAFDFESDGQIKELSNSLEIDSNRLISWIFLRNILSAQWFIEDNGDPSKKILAAKKYLNYLS